MCVAHCVFLHIFYLKGTRSTGMYITVRNTDWNEFRWQGRGFSLEHYRLESLMCLAW